MELDQLRYFVAAAETLSMSRAAERVHVTQPALSRSVARLERELKTPLFDRVKKRIELTDAGRFFLARARRILCDAETSAQQVRERWSDARRSLRLGFLSPLLDDVVAPALRELRRLSPRTRVALFELRPGEQLERLRAHELDAALLGNVAAADRADLDVRPLSRHPVAAVLPADDARARKRSLPLFALSGDRFLSLSESAFPGRRALLSSWCRPAGFEPDVAREVDSLGLLLTAVAAGEGVALLPRHAEKLPHAGATFVALAAPVPQVELLLVLPKSERAANGASERDGERDPELARWLDVLTQQVARAFPPNP
jgi:DNA-binding transcriptional LysR family regulator